VALAEREGAEAVLRATDGHAAGEVGLRVPIDSTLLGRCFLDGQLLRAPDDMRDSPAEQGLGVDAVMRSALFVPLFGRGTASAEVESVLVVASSEPLAFTDAEAETLQGIAEFLSTALSRASSFSGNRPGHLGSWWRARSGSAISSKPRAKESGPSTRRTARHS
jgi:GAF domain-containing protein